jgi:putative nucleotidyltransferase with HDIG domain
MSEVVDQALQTVAPLPDNIQRLIEMINDPRTGSDDIATIVHQDPVLATKALHLCNSVYYSLPVEVTSIYQAVKFLGMDMITGLAMAAYFQNQLQPSRKDADNPWLKGTRSHIMSTAQFTEYFVREMCRSDDDSLALAFTAGLLHDIGKLALSGLSGDAAARVKEAMQAKDISLHEAEREVLGTDHAEVGWHLAQRWTIPGIVEDAITYHHAPFQGQHDISLVVFICDTVVHGLSSMKRGSTMYVPVMLYDALGELGMTKKDLVSLIHRWIALQKHNQSHACASA